MRLLLPFASDRESAEVTSLRAAIDLGLRLHFKGKVSHLRSSLVETKEGPLTRRYLYLYDSVPGGTGYLKQLASRTDDMLDVFRVARDHMVACVCNKDSNKDGCPRCIRSHAATFGRGEISRDSAVRQINQILAGWPKLHAIATVSDVKLNKALESELEQMFVERLRRAVKNRGGVFTGRSSWPASQAMRSGWMPDPGRWSRSAGSRSGSRTCRRPGPTWCFGPQSRSRARSRWRSTSTAGISTNTLSQKTSRSGRRSCGRGSCSSGRRPGTTSLRTRRLGGQNTTGNRSRISTKASTSCRTAPARPTRRRMSTWRRSTSFSISRLGRMRQGGPRGSGRSRRHGSCKALRPSRTVRRSRRSSMSLPGPRPGSPWPTPSKTPSARNSRRRAAASSRVAASKSWRPPAWPELGDLTAVVGFEHRLAKSSEAKRAWSGALRLMNLLQFLPYFYVGCARSVAPEAALRPTEAPVVDIWSDVADVVLTDLLPLVQELRRRAAPTPEALYEAADADGEVFGTFEIAWPDKRLASSWTRRSPRRFLAGPCAYSTVTPA